MTDRAAVAPDRPRAVGRVPPALAAALDLGAVVLFVVLGRRSHGDGSALAGLVRVAWPFALGLAAAGVLTRTWWRPRDWRRALPAWACTVAVGMVLRIAVQGRDLEVSFVVVTALFLGAVMLAWRIAARWWTTRADARVRGGVDRVRG